MKKVAANVFVETRWLEGCNPGFVTTADGIIMIDTPYRPAHAVRWREEIEKRGSVKYILNTEFHNDHTTGNSFFPGVVIAHEATKEGLEGFIKQVGDVRQSLKGVFPEDTKLLENYHPRLVDITFSKRLSLYTNSHTVEMIHAPGHTLGETAIYIPQEKVVFTGDNFCNGIQPSLDYCYPQEWLASLQQILSLDVEVVVPGHGEVGDKDALQKFTSFLEEYVTAVQKAIEQDLSKEEAVARINFEDRLQAFHPGPEQQRKNVLRLYERLTEE